MTEQKITKAYNLRATDVTVIELLAEGNGCNCSAALRQIVAEWAQTQPLRVLGQACALSLMSPEQALEQLTAIVFEMPVPYVMTEEGEAALSSP